MEDMQADDVFLYYCFLAEWEEGFGFIMKYMYFLQFSFVCWFVMDCWQVKLIGFFFL